MAIDATITRRTVAIKGLAARAPHCSIAQADAAAIALDRCCHSPDQARLLPVLYRRTNVRRRGTALAGPGANGRGLAEARAFFPPAVDSDDRGPATAARMARYRRSALPLAAEAATAALRDAGLTAGDIDQLVVVSCTGFYSPGIDVQLIEQLAMRPTTGRTIVGFMGCHGAVNGLRVAHAMCAAEPGVNALMVAVELCSLHFAYGWDPQRIVANALFADGAAAVVLGGDVPVSRTVRAPGPGAASNRPWSLAATGSCLIPDSADAMTWTIGDHGFEMTLSPRVPELIEEHLRPWLAGWLGDHGLSIGDVASWAIHPGGPRILHVVECALELPESALAASHATLAEHGNMSSPTLLFILDRLRRDGARPPCVALAFGPGVMAEAAVFI